MNTSFEFFNPHTIDLDSDHPNFYRIETFDNGRVYCLQLIDKQIDMVVDSLSLEHKCSLDNIHPVWHNHKVIQSVFNRADYIDDAPQDALDMIKAQMKANNQMTVVEFLKDHNDREDRIDAAYRELAIRAGREVTLRGV